MRILFVCEGNTCRSPLAEMLLKKELQNHGLDGITVSSAGIWADSGIPPSREMVDVAKELFDIDISGHKSSGICSDIFRQSDLVLTMTVEEAEFLRKLFPLEKGKIFNIGEYIDGRGRDVEDPFGKGKDVYVEIARQLDVLIKSLVAKLE